MGGEQRLIFLTLLSMMFVASVVPALAITSSRKSEEKTSIQYAQLGRSRASQVNKLTQTSRDFRQVFRLPGQRRERIRPVHIKDNNADGRGKKLVSQPVVKVKADTSRRVDQRRRREQEQTQMLQKQWKVTADQKERSKRVRREDHNDLKLHTAQQLLLKRQHRQKQRKKQLHHHPQLQHHVAQTKPDQQRVQHQLTKSSHFVRAGQKQGINVLSLPSKPSSGKTNREQEQLEAEQLKAGSVIKPLNHPFLFFSEGDIAHLQRQAQGSHSAIFTHIEHAVEKILKAENRHKYFPPVLESDFAKYWNEHYGNNLLVLSFYATLAPEKAEKFMPLIELYMVRLSGYHSWEVKGQRGDDVPRAHTLLGLSVAFDLLRSKLDVEASVSIAQKIRDEAFRFWGRVQKGAGWGYQYNHNHLLTCQTALLASALAIQPHYPLESIEWQKVARQPLERTLLLLRYIVDGSDAEGVGYSTYSTRSLFMYILLVRRHFGQDHTHHPWLKAHFEFLLSTTLPGYSGSVGIADAPPTWFYGPEAQLYFLDRFVLRSGHANWLARKIRTLRLAGSTDGRLTERDWPMLIHEFLWYAPHIGFQQPPSVTKPRLSVFADWGVATFGGGSPPNNTFLSFKSGHLHGRGMYSVAHRKPLSWIQGWESFNSGHEHPDQGSFTFYPHGQPFITESFYGPKYSFLDNVWLFRHSVPGKKQCGGPYLQGQLGECTRWLKWRNHGVGDTAADILAADQQNGMLFVAGEFAKAYPVWLMIESATRALFLLNKETLVIVDHISLHHDSPVKGGNVFFNNLYQSFRISKPTDLLSLNSKAQTADGQHHIQWVADVGSAAQDMIGAQAGSFNEPQLAGKRGGQNTSFYLNVSVPFGQRTSRVAWLLTSGNSKSGAQINFVDISAEGVSLHVDVGWQTYRISLATNQRHLRARYHLHHHGGLAQVQTSGEMTRFGLLGRPVPLVTVGPLARIQKALPWAARPEVLSLFSLITLLLVIAALLAMNTLRWLNRARNIWVIIVLLMNWFVVVLFVFIVGVLNNLEDGRPAQQGLRDPHTVQGPHLDAVPPSILLTGLPQMGQDIFTNMFIDSNDLYYVNLRQSSVVPPTVGHTLSRTLHPCVWSTKQVSTESMSTAWVQSLFRKPQTHFAHVLSNHDQAGTAGKHSLQHKVNMRRISSEAIKRLAMFPSLRLVLGDDIGSWMLKSEWFSNIFLRNAARIIIIMQDPRRWVAAVLESNTLVPDISKTLIEQLQEIKTNSKSACDEDLPCAIHFNSMISLLEIESQRPQPSLVKLLATLWSAYTRTALCMRERNRWQQHIVHFEDLHSNPVDVAAGVYQFIGLPFPPAVRHRLLLVMRSELGEFKQIRRALKGNSQRTLSAKDKAIVEEICKEEMASLGYHIISHNNGQENFHEGQMD